MPPDKGVHAVFPRDVYAVADDVVQPTAATPGHNDQPAGRAPDKCAFVRHIIRRGVLAIGITLGLRAFYGDFTTPDKTSSHDTRGFTVLHVKTAKTLHDRKFLKRNDLSRKPDGEIPFP